MSRHHCFLVIIIFPLILFGLVGPVPVAQASTSNSVRTSNSSLNLTHVADTIPFLLDSQLVSKEENYPGATPALFLPGTIMANATSAQGAIVIYTVNASDPDNPASLPTITCTPPSGSYFPIGTTTVFCMASNASGNSTSGIFLVTVVDRTPPVLYLPGTIVANATSSLGAIVNYTVSATDPIDPANLPTLTCIPPSGSVFPIGTTIVYCTASNPMGYSTTSGSFQLTVKKR
jgi:HYR domain